MAGSDAGHGEPTVEVRGLRLSLLGAADVATLHRWFDALAADGRVVDPLTLKAWGASDSQVVDRHGLHWLIGYEP